MQNQLQSLTQHEMAQIQGGSDYSGITGVLRWVYDQVYPPNGGITQDILDSIPDNTPAVPQTDKCNSGHHQ